MPATIYQQKVIDKTSGPTIVLAGAGSGKTHTMCERIVSAIEKGRAGDKSCPASIDEVVAITFTNKAAGELKSRIRSLLNARGLKSDARAVDDACISTIHGLASRILRENALTFGIDPVFKLLSDLKEKIEVENISEDIRDMLASGSYLIDGTEPDLMLVALASYLGEEETSEFDNFFKSIKVRLDSQVDGCDKLTYVENKLNPIEIISTLANLFPRAIDILESADSLNRYESKYLEQFRDSQRRANDFLETLQNNADVPIDIDVVSGQAAELLFSFPATTESNPSQKSLGDSGYEFFKQYRATLARCVYSMLIFAKFGTNFSVLPYAKLYDFYQKQHFKNFQFTNNTLLKSCLDALLQHPNIAKSYQDKFKMIIVDEFQDTDKVQIELIKQIAKPEFDDVCTVGDIQQSIYSFRGADVSAFREYRDDVLAKNPNAQVFELPNNFRSHKEIIAFVEHIFSTEYMFGNEFLRLTSNSSINDINDPIFDSEETGNFKRVSVEIMHGNSYARDASKKFTTSELTDRTAKKIALHFRKLIDQGEKPGDMALLLGSMNNLKAYRNALMQVGINSIVTGGSDFHRCAEPKLVLNILQVMENMKDEVALCNLLKGRLFSISDASLIYLTHTFDEERRCYIKKPLSVGFYAFDENWKSYPITDAEFDKLVFARKAIKALLAEASVLDPISSIRQLLLTCGVVNTMEENPSIGISEAGNFEKSFLIIKQIMEDEKRGIAGIASDFELFLEGGKEKPSVYSTVGGNYLQIMTIHASKGLQFDHVAVVDFDDGKPSRNETKNNFYAECIDDKIYYCACDNPKSFNSRMSFNKYLSADELSNYDFGSSIDDDLTEVYLTIRKKHKDNALEEAKRKLYVALTRAVKSVVLYVKLGSQYKKDEGYTKKGIINDLYNSLKWLPEGFRSKQNLDYCGDRLGELTYESLPFSDEAKQTDEVELEFEKIRIDNTSKSSSFKVYPEYKPVATEYFAPPSKVRDIHSYSSLLKAINNPDLKASNENPGYDPVLFGSIVSDTDESATAFGTEFHIAMQRSLLGIDDNNDCVAMSKRCKCAIDVWNACPEKVKLHSCSNVFAEHEFSAMITIDGNSENLIGEVDALGFNDKSYAYVVDYKTGAFAHDHTLQAAVYAYALLMSGFESVELDFVHVEILNKKTGSPFVVNFKYGLSDIAELENSISKAFRETYK